jgi:hypothetical protein
MNPYLGWWLVLPFDVTDMRVVDGMSALWVACLLFPLGYWSAAALRRDVEPQPVAVVTALVVGACIVGLVVLPRALGYPRPPGSVWIGAAAGLALGALASTLYGSRSTDVMPQVLTERIESADAAM